MKIKIIILSVLSLLVSSFFAFHALSLLQRDDLTTVVKVISFAYFIYGITTIWTLIMSWKKPNLLLSNIVTYSIVILMLSHLFLVTGEESLGNLVANFLTTGAILSINWLAVKIVLKDKLSV